MLNLSFSVNAQPAGSHNTLNYEIDRTFSGQVLHTIQLENPTGQEIVGGKLLVPLIINETSRHYAILYDRTSTTGDFTTFNDSSGNMYICWDNLTIRPGQRCEAALSYFVFSFGIRYRIDSGLIGDYDKHSDLYVKHIQPEDLVQSDSPEIVSKAQSITQGIMDIHDQVSKIYGFVTSHVRYSHEEQERGALWALTNGTGDCSEYSYLFVALCRAAGIPARLNVGFGFRPSDENTTDVRALKADMSTLMVQDSNGDYLFSMIIPAATQTMPMISLSLTFSPRSNHPRSTPNAGTRNNHVET